MERYRDIRILRAEEQTLLSRERTMHSSIQTGLAFVSVGLVLIKFPEGILYVGLGLMFMLLGALLSIESGRRYVPFRRAIRELRQRETELGYRLGTIR